MTRHAVVVIGLPMNGEVTVKLVSGLLVENFQRSASEEGASILNVKTIQVPQQAFPKIIDPKRQDT